MPREREGNECTSSEGETESEADREAETKRKKKIRTIKKEAPRGLQPHAQ